MTTTDVNTMAVTFVLSTAGALALAPAIGGPPLLPLFIGKVNGLVLLLTILGASVVTMCDVAVVWFSARVVLRSVITTLITVVKAVVYVDVAVIVMFWPVDINVEFDNVSESVLCNVDTGVFNMPLNLEEELVRFKLAELPFPTRSVVKIDFGGTLDFENESNCSGALEEPLRIGEPLNDKPTELFVAAKESIMGSDWELEEKDATEL